MKSTAIALILYALTISSFAQKLETLVQRGHNASVKAITTSHNGLWVATGSRDRTAKLWNAESGKEIRSFVGHLHSVNGLSFSPDDQFLATSSADNTAKVWEVKTGNLVFSTPTFDKYVTDVTFSPNGNWLAVIGFNDSAYVYDWKNRKLKTKIAVNADQGSGYGAFVKFSPDNQWLGIGEDNRTVKLYATSDFELKHSFKPENGWCGGCGTLLAFNSTSSLVAKMPHSGVVTIHQLSTGKTVFELPYPQKTDKVQGIEFHPAKNELFVLSDQILYHYDVDAKKLIDSTSFKDKSEIQEMKLSNDAENLWLSFANHKAEKWAISPKKFSTTLSGVSEFVDHGGVNYNPDSYWESFIAKYLKLKNPLLMLPNGKTYLTGKHGTKLIEWDITTSKPLKTFKDHEKAVIAFDLQKDGKTLATGDAAGNVTLWDLSSNKQIKKWKAHREPIFSVKFNPRNKTILTTSWDGTAIVWDLDDLQKESVLDLNNNSAYDASFSTDGLYVVLSKLDKTVQMIEPDSKKLVFDFKGHTDVVGSLDFFGKSQMLTSSWDGTARIWDLGTGLITQKFKAGKSPLLSAIFSKDGKFVFTAGDERIIKKWEVSSGKMLGELKGHQTEITSLQVSQDGKMLVSYSLDGAVKFWNLESENEFFEHLHVDEFTWMAITKDGFFNATESARKWVNFVKGTEVFVPDQFFDEFYKPEKLEKIIKTRGVSTEKQSTIGASLNKSPLPTLKMYAKKIEGETHIELHLKMIDNGGGVKNLKITHNGKQIQLNEKNIVYPFPNQPQLLTLKIEPVSGNNDFMAIAANQSNLEAHSNPVQYFEERTLNSQITCHLLAIGINTYKNSLLNLNYAKNDAESFVDIFKTQTEKLYDKFSIHTLFDENATKEQILRKLEQIALESASHDVFVFFYAGHGTMTDGQFYMVSHECTRLQELETLKSKALSSEELQQRFKQIKALKQIIIMDACQSGGSVETLASRGAEEEKAIAQLSRSAGIHVLASAGSDQFAKELSTLNHGLFTYVLLEALRGKADGSPKDGKITVYELKSYLDDQVPELNQKIKGKTQYPYTFSRGQDFPISKF